VSDPGIFIAGAFVFLMVATAGSLIGWGLVKEREDRAELDARADEAGAGEVSTATSESGRTRATGPVDRRP
jgi:hypothetical protein